MKKYFVSLLLIFFIAFGLLSLTSYAAEVPDTASTLQNDAISSQSKAMTSSPQEKTSQNHQTTFSEKTTSEKATTENVSTIKTSQDNVSTQNKTQIVEQHISSPQTNSTSSTTVTSQTSSEVPTQEKASQTTQTSSAQLQTSKENITAPKAMSQKTSSTSSVQTSRPSTNVSTQKATLTQTSKSQDTTTLNHKNITTQTTSNTKATTPSSTTHAILHTNDIHGRFVEEDGRVIGMAKVKGLKDQIQPDLVLDAGDAFQGLPVSNKSKGEEMAKAMNSVGYDAMTIGNHEFDFGYDQLMKLQQQLNFPMLSSNIYKDGHLIFKPSTIITKNNIRYGVVGVTTPETKTKTSPTAVNDIEFKDPLPSVTQAMNDIKDNVDVFVILSHLGVDKSTRNIWRSDYLIDQLTQSKLFSHPIFVVDGHSHTVIEHGRDYGANNVLTQTGTALANVGRIDFDVHNGTINNVNASLINVADTKEVPTDSQIEAQTRQANNEFLKETSTVIIPNNPVTLNGEREHVRTQETNLGNLITDAMEAYAEKNFSHRPDFAVTNGGGIRASIQTGQVTENDVITVLPFGNLISQIEVKGSDVKQAFEHSLSSTTDIQDGKKVLAPSGGFLQVSNSIRVYFNLDKESGQRVSAIKILNKSTGKYENLDSNRTYYVTTNDFTAHQGDGYDMFGGKREEGISLDAVVSQYIKEADLSSYDTVDAVRIINGQPEIDEQTDDATTTQPHDQTTSSQSNTHLEGAQPKHPGKVSQPNKKDNDHKVVAIHESPHPCINHHKSIAPKHHSNDMANTNHKHLTSTHTQQCHTHAIAIDKHKNYTGTHAHINHYDVAHHPIKTMLSLENKLTQESQYHNIAHLIGPYQYQSNQELTSSKACHTNKGSRAYTLPLKHGTDSNTHQDSIHVVTINDSEATSELTGCYTNKHHVQLPSTGKKEANLEHGIAILLVTTGAGLIYLRQRKKSA
ncbi:5'-nucleotidase C-terminal domain-containing protein [Staphylococcus hominis]|uniref:5'-nucleotidase C-terminal domain-containing protein n=1 Tax=Staphylococcus hominis TaxID=1290 RepID=UPI0011A926FF|nr:5'-nucleotidase C-terminal domain-containing protein [Staphylococcus hominis]